MLVSDYNYDLPDERIAKFPPKERGSTRLLVLNRQTGAIQDSFYRNLDDFLNPGDVLILNDTRVMQSRLFCTLPDGRKRELVVLEKHGDEPQRVMYRGKLHDGDILSIDKHQITISKILGNGIAEVESEAPLAELAEKYGTVPLPPYLHRDATEDDKKRYQTIWAKNMGSAAAPTASLNMTEDLLNRLQQKGIIIKYITLHVGLGTFLPMRTDNVEDHHMHSEWFHIPEDTLKVIKNHDKRIVAVGTTVARTLEYYAKTGKTEGEDDIFIYPGFKFQLVDALLTNYHAPKSTVLMLASAFAGWDHLKNAYDHAIAEKYNFLSYGDSVLIC
ncbi:tRNA preQ1(34) S-adenosylmethionine ribosyltransferase-isomerase QueA [Candidatus Saccharibacteria bacterium]|nr:tRNA preQ1(34) S-adenosylmethionine ribosyltransferase-isomerase QueA [Candidatus Saccharibacteria bacterium]